MIESYGGQGSKYVEVPRLKYLVVQKHGTKYQKEWTWIPLMLLIGFLKIPSIDQQPPKIQGKSTWKYPLVLCHHCNRAYIIKHLGWTIQHPHLPSDHLRTSWNNCISRTWLSIDAWTIHDVRIFQLNSATYRDKISAPFFSCLS